MKRFLAVTLVVINYFISNTKLGVQNVSYSQDGVQFISFKTNTIEIEPKYRNNFMHKQ